MELKNIAAILVLSSIILLAPLSFLAAQKTSTLIQKPPVIIVTDASWEVSGDQIEFGEYAQWSKNLPANGSPLKGGSKAAEVAATFDRSTLVAGTQPIWRRYHASDEWEVYMFRKTIQLAHEPIKSVTLQVNCDDAARVYINQRLVDPKKLNAQMGNQRGRNVNFKQLTTFMYDRIDIYDVTDYFFANSTNTIVAEVMNQPFGGNHAYLSARITVEFAPIAEVSKQQPPTTVRKVTPATVKPTEKTTVLPKIADKSANPPITPESQSAPATRVFRTSSDAVIEKLKAGDILELGNIHFKTNAHAFDSTSNKTLMALAKLLKDNPNLKIEVGGHTNLLPDINFANRLSENRAKSVAAFLTGQGVAATQVAYKGYGKATPKVMGTSAAANRQNQRVEIKILEK